MVPQRHEGGTEGGTITEVSSARDTRVDVPRDHRHARRARPCLDRGALSVGAQVLVVGRRAQVRNGDGGAGASATYVTASGHAHTTTPHLGRMSTTASGNERSGTVVNNRSVVGHPVVDHKAAPAPAQRRSPLGGRPRALVRASLT